MDRQQFLKKLPSLVKNYKPTPGILERLKNLELLMIVGPTGAGKTSIINKLNIKYVPSDTTRAPRPHEVEGQDFFFRTDYDQIVNEINAGEFVQIVVDPSGDLKGTIANVYPLEGWISMAVVTDAVPIFWDLGFKKTLSAYIVPPSYEEWMRRLKHQHLKPAEHSKRLEEAKRSIKFALADKTMHFILNDDLEKAVAQTNSLLKGKRDQSREEEARAVAAQILSELNSSQ